jgi:hypothetical protein
MAFWLIGIGLRYIRKQSSKKSENPMVASWAGYNKNCIVLSAKIMQLEVLLYLVNCGVAQVCIPRFHHLPTFCFSCRYEAYFARLIRRINPGWIDVNLVAEKCHYANAINARPPPGV